MSIPPCQLLVPTQGYDTLPASGSVRARQHLPGSADIGENMSSSGNEAMMKEKAQCKTITLV